MLNTCIQGFLLSFCCTSSQSHMYLNLFSLMYQQATVERVKHDDSIEMLDGQSQQFLNESCINTSRVVLADFREEVGNAQPLDFKVVLERGVILYRYKKLTRTSLTVFIEYDRNSVLSPFIPFD